MALDALCLAAAAYELRAALLDARVDKVYQPGRNEVVLAMHTYGGNEKLLLCAEPGFARAQLTDLNRENPATPPVFCMLLRKHLTGGRLTAIVQPQGERILRFSFDCTDELGDHVARHLILEAIGTGTNLIFTDGEDRILASTRRMEGDLTSGKRQVMAGLYYRLPDPVAGFPPLIRREIEFRGKETVEEGVARLEGEIETGQFTPTLLKKDGKASDFSFLSILQYGPGVENVPCPDFKTLFDRYYTEKEAGQRAAQRDRGLQKTVQTLRDRAKRKVANQQRELAQAKDREALRRKGELLTANFYRLEKGMDKAVVEDYYDEACPTVEIALDPRLTPQQNAAKYFKDYAKARTAEEILTTQIAKGEGEVEYLESVLEGIALAEGDRDLNEVRRELEQGGYLRGKKAAKREMKVSSKPLELRSSAGLRISVGKNNTQNDHLTLKAAGKWDWWFHAQKSHGAHVILWTEGQEPDEKSVEEAAALAAWYSQAREADKVAVDYTPVKYIKKPAGAKPGMVVYTTYQTAMVKPQGPQGLNS